ncbi:MAG: PKD domain-containing protein, partial [Bacteroidota bacterium]
MKTKFFCLIFILSLFLSAPVFAQYILNGAATKNSCNCYTLTTPVTTQTGSVWNANKISLSQSFDFWFNVFLGCSDRGADGIVFILQPISTSIGTSGEGMGFGGVSPSIGIALDTYQNFNLADPFYDHISIQANGIINHSADLAGPVPASALSNDVEDCQWHNLRISWNAVTKTLTAYFDGVQRVQKHIDLVATIFNNDPNVFWGFTGATGGEVNLQQFCTALDPDFSTNFPSNIACAPASLQFNNQSQSFAPIASYSWRFGNGDSSNLQNPSPVLFPQPGVYDVRLKITGLDGCENDTVKTITIGSVPNATLQVFDTCFKNEPRLKFTANNFGVNYQWLLNGNVISTTAQPQ